MTEIFEIQKDYTGKVISRIVQGNEYWFDVYFTDGSHLKIYAWGHGECGLGYEEGEGEPLTPRVTGMSEVVYVTIDSRLKLKGM